MIAIIVFWTLILVSLKLLALVIVDAFRPLPKPTAKRKPRKSPFLDPLSVTLMAMAKGRGSEDLLREEWAEPLTPDEVTVKIDLWGFDLEAQKRLVGLRKWEIARHGYRPKNYHGLSPKFVRAKLALAKDLGIPLKRVLNEDLWRHPDYLRWNGLTLNLVLGNRGSGYQNLNYGWIKKSAYYDYGDGSPAPDYYIWMLPNDDFSEWKVVGVLSFSDLNGCVKVILRSSKRYEKRKRLIEEIADSELASGESQDQVKEWVRGQLPKKRRDLLENEQFFGIRLDSFNRPTWVHPIEWFRQAVYAATARGCE